MKRPILLLAALLAAPTLAHAELVITISGGESSAQPIAVVPFAQPGDSPLQFAEVIAADLGRTGQFAPLPVNDMLEKPSEAGQVNYRNWRAVAVDNVVIGKVRRGPGGALVVHFELLDVLRAQTLMGYDVPVADVRRPRTTAHQIADMIYQKLTGIPGAFNSQIAYVTANGKPDNRLYQIMIADSDGENPIAVATSREPLMSPAWSPDRRQLAYVGFYKGRSAIFIQTPDTGEVRQLIAERGINGAPAWSPDGRQLALTLSFERNPDIYVVDVASGARRRLTEHFAIDTEPAWSPDGSQIAFTSDRGGQPQIYAVPAAGGEARRITFEGKQNTRPRYSPDGKSLALVNVNESGYRIGLLNLVTHELQILSSGPLDESPSFSPNGAVVIYAAQGKQGAELATVSIDGRIRQRLSQPGDVREPAWSPLIH